MAYGHLEYESVISSVACHYSCGAAASGQRGYNWAEYKCLRVKLDTRLKDASMKKRPFMLLYLMLTVAIWAKAQSRNWQTGRLTQSERVKVREGSTESTTLDGYLNFSRNSYSPDNTNTTATTDNYQTYQVFTIKAGHKIYVVREPLFYPWSKPVLSKIGEPVKLAVENNILYILGENGKQHKTGIIEVRSKSSLAGQTWQNPTPS